jgi:hypothetical protein
MGAKSLSQFVVVTIQHFVSRRNLDLVKNVMGVEVESASHPLHDRFALLVGPIIYLEFLECLVPRNFPLVIEDDINDGPIRETLLSRGGVIGETLLSGGGVV